MTNEDLIIVRLMSFYGLILAIALLIPISVFAQSSQGRFSATDAKEIGKSLNVNWDKTNVDEFTKGINIELEHGLISPETNVTKDDRTLTGKIVLSHLNEFPDYYTRLEKFESDAREYWKK